MDSVFECGQCFIPYDEQAHKPLSLPCGHVFCQDCLLKQTKDFITCPIDKFSFNVQAFTLPCCYTILANLPKHIKKASSCIRHPKRKVKFMCKSHEKFLCTECVVDHTGAGHNIVAFSINTSVVKSELKDLESICEATLKENEDLYKDLESKSKIVKDFYHLQLSRISVAYENAIKILQQKKRELQSSISKYLSDQCKVIEKHKEGVSKILESSTKLLQQLKFMEKDLPHYESLCSNIKSLKQELKYLEYPIETFHYQYMSFKSPETINFIFGTLEELEDLSELESLGQKPKKSCSHTVKSVLTNTNLNENPTSTKSTTPKILEKNFKPEDKNPENRSPDKAEKVTKNRQNFNSRNHPKRMPWKKRNRSL